MYIVTLQLGIELLPVPGINQIFFLSYDLVHLIIFLKWVY